MTDDTLRQHLSRAGKASAAKLTPEQRKERARKGGLARAANAAARAAGPKLDSRGKPIPFSCGTCVPGRRTKAGWIWCKQCGGNVTPVRAERP